MCLCVCHVTVVTVMFDSDFVILFARCVVELCTFHSYNVQEN